MLRLLQAYREGFRRWVRRHTRPLSIEEAEEKRLFWAKVYALMSISVFGVLSYFVYTENIDFPFREDLPKNVAVGVQLKGNEAFRFISFRGFEKVSDFKYSKEEIQKLAQSNPKSKAGSKSEINESMAES